MDQQPAIGRIVHFVMDRGHHPGECRPAMIVKLWTGQPPYTAQLQVFVDSTNDYSNYGSQDGTEWRTSIVHDAEKKPATYHFHTECE